jgi:hypothetical protein
MLLLPISSEPSLPDEIDTRDSGSFERIWLAQHMLISTEKYWGGTAHNPSPNPHEFPKPNRF